MDEPPGDVLVFLTGQEEIESLARLLAERAAALPGGGQGGAELRVLPLFAALPPEQQIAVRRSRCCRHAMCTAALVRLAQPPVC